MFRRTMFLAALGLAWVAASARADSKLGVGDPAPKLEVKEWVKGDKVPELAKGQVYVVEFWATWCGPCRTSIPHLTELQKKYKDATFIGVSVYESNQKAVKPFVDEMGDKMDYRVAMDDVPEGGKQNEGKMAKGWMDAAEQQGIPTAFIIDRDTKVAWIGHPMQMEKPLDQVVAGKWDLKVARAEYVEKKAQARKMQQLQQKLGKARQESPKAFLAALNEVIKEDPKMEPMLATAKYQALLSEDQKMAAEYGKKLVDGAMKDNAQGLNFIAWGIVDPAAKQKPDAELLKLALQAAQRADELTKSKDAQISDTLAKAYFDNGDAAKALEIQERAMKLAKGTPTEKDPGVIERLEQYRKAAKK